MNVCKYLNVQSYKHCRSFRCASSADGIKTHNGNEGIRKVNKNTTHTNTDKNNNKRGFARSSSRSKWHILVTRLVSARCRIAAEHKKRKSLAEWLQWRQQLWRRRRFKCARVPCQQAIKATILCFCFMTAFDAVSRWIREYSHSLYEYVDMRVSVCSYDEALYTTTLQGICIFIFFRCCIFIFASFKGV